MVDLLKRSIIIMVMLSTDQSTKPTQLIALTSDFHTDTANVGLPFRCWKKRN